MEVGELDAFDSNSLARRGATRLHWGERAHEAEPFVFGDQEPVLIYIAKRLRDALRLESIFTASRRGLRRRRPTNIAARCDLPPGYGRGVRSYVLPEAWARRTRSMVCRNGYKPHEGEAG